MSYAMAALLGNPGMEISCIYFLWWFSFNLTAVTAVDSFWCPLSFSQIMCYCSWFLIGHLLTFESLRQYPPLLQCVLYKKIRSVSCLISFHLGLDVKFCCLVAVFKFFKCICRFLIFLGTLVCLCVVLIKILWSYCSAYWIGKKVSPFCSAPPMHIKGLPTSWAEQLCFS